MVQTTGVSTYVGNQGHAHSKSMKVDALATCSECILDFSSVETYERGSIFITMMFAYKNYLLLSADARKDLAMSSASKERGERRRKCLQNNGLSHKQFVSCFALAKRNPL